MSSLPIETTAIKRDLSPILSAGEANRVEAIKRTILSAGDLPTLPQIALEVNQLASNPLTGMNEIVRIIRNDPALTAKILRVSNSAFYGMSGRVESLNMALVVLGMREINNLVTCISIFKAFPNKPGEQRFDRKTFWEHSAACGEIARVIASKLHLRMHGVEFTAGLLHDIGKVVLEQHYHDEFMAALTFSQAQNLVSTEAERNVLGVDHAEIGAWLCERWHLPECITEAIRYHHQPTLAPQNKTLSAVVHLSDIITNALISGNVHATVTYLLSGDPAWDILTTQHPEIIGLDVVQFVEELEENIERAREFIRIASG
jgi:putative nucleotidyltransferase with HDIG domain